MSTGSRCSICNKFLERGDNEEWNNAVESEAEDCETGKTYYFFLCKDCAIEQEA